MKSNGTSADSLKSRQSLLKTELSAAREKTALLSAKLKEAEKAFGANSQEAKNLATQVTNAKNVEAAIQGEIGQVNQAFKEQERNTSSLTQAVTKADAKIGELDKELELNQSKLSGTADKTTLLNDRQQLLAQQSDASADKVKALENALDTCGKEVGENSDEYRELKSRLTDAKIEQSAIQNEIQATTKELKEQKTAVEQSAEKIGNFGRKADEWGNKTRAASAVAAGGLAAVGGAAIQFESAFAGVMKTNDEVYDANGKLVYSYADLEKGIRNMAKELPSSAKQISEVAENAGQLGIKTQDVLGFTRVMINMGESTNLSADEASVSLAKFANITGLAADTSMDARTKYGKLGSSIVALGNNFATNEQDIVAMSTKLASAGTLAGLTEQEILALATSMSSVGIEAEAGGTAMTQTLTAIEKAAVTGGKSLDQFAQVSGMSASEFKNKWENEPIVAIQSFIKGLGNLDEKGESATLMLDEMGLSGVRQSNMLKSLALSSDNLGNAVKLSGEAWEENTALTDEANKRYETTASQLAIMKNNLVDAGITLGSTFLPIIRSATEKVTAFAEKLSGLSNGQKKMLLGVVAAVAGLSTFLNVIGKVSIGAEALLKGGSKLAGMFAKGGTAAMTGGTTMSGAMALPLAPILGVVAAIGAIIAIFAVLWTKSEDFKNFFTGMWEGFKDVIAGFLEKINFGDKIESIKNKFSGLGEKLKGLSDFFKIIGSVLSVVLVPAIGILSGLFNVLLGAIEPIIDIIGGVIDILSGLGSMIVGVFTGDLEKAKEGATTFGSGLLGIFSGIFSGIWNILTGLLTGMASFFMSLFEKIGIIDFVNKVKTAFQSVFETVKTIFTTIGNVVSTVFETIKNVISVGIQFIASLFSAAFQILTVPFQFIWENCKNIIITVWSAIQNTISTVINSIKNVVTTVFNAIRNTITTIFNAVRNTVTTVWNAIRNAITTPINAAKNTVSSVFNAIRSTISSVVNSVRSTVSSVFNAVRNAITSPLSAASATVSGIFSGIYNAISSKINAAKDAVSGAISKIKGFFNFSWSLPELKLPHPTITGKFSLNPPSVPHFGIKWRKKGAILTKPTIFGFANGNFQGGGEAGMEAVLPIEKLNGFIENALNNVLAREQVEYEVIDYNKLAYAMANVKISTQLNGKELIRYVREES